ncbi:MAG: cyclophilin-like fold protein [Saprospiraceae bacterium]|nr:cyclophilin-like fold protein [Saprospiraceae bacterium]
MTHIAIKIGKYEFAGELYDTPTAKAIVASLPFESSALIWGDEIYFHVPAQAVLEPEAVAQVEVGDLAYWPSMPAFCIFFGRTPASIGEEPRAASAVNVFGRLTTVDLEALHGVKDGDRITVEC